MALAYTKSIPANRPLKIFEGTIDLAAAVNATDPMAEQEVDCAGLLADDMVVSFQPIDACTFGIGYVRVKEAGHLGVMLVNTDTDTDVDPAGTLNYRLIVCPAI